MTDLPAELRDHAAQAVFKAHQPAAYGSDVTWDDLDEPQRNRWRRDVDAVAGVLASRDALQAQAERHLRVALLNQRLRATGVERQARVVELEATLERAESSYVEARAVVELRQSEKVELQARVEELSAILESKDASLRTLVAQLDQATVRVEQLTVALTEMLSQDLPGRIWDEKVRALLAAAPTPGDQPHICQPPDIDTLSESRVPRWDCPSCGVGWIATGHIRYGRVEGREWRRMQKGNPTGERTEP